jgi:hypothetical protein
MKKLFALSLFIPLSLSLFAQKDPQKSGGLLKKASSIFSKNVASENGLTTQEVVTGLKEALARGSQKSSAKLSMQDGFFKDAAVKILLPEEVQKSEEKFRALGLGTLVENVVLTMNRAAEDASRQAAPIFLAAIQKMTIDDAMSILKGSDTAATSYLRNATTARLTAAFKPIIEESLQKVKATKYWSGLAKTYNKISSQQVETDLNSYVTNQALNGIFYYVAKEEENIRKNPAARATDILKKVFGQ